MNVKILCNDEAKDGFYEEHGLSILVNDEILFDTGASDVFIKNAKKMKVDLRGIKKIVVSHGHYDHVGGLKYLIGKVNAPVYIHKNAVIPKYSGDRFVGSPFEIENLKLEKKFIKGNIKIDNLYVINNVPLEKIQLIKSIK